MIIKLRKGFSILRIILFIAGLMSIISLSSGALQLFNVMKPYEKLENRGMSSSLEGVAKYIPSPAFQYLVADGVMIVELADYIALKFGKQDVAQFNYFEELKESTFITFNKVPEIAEVVNKISEGQLKESDKASVNILIQEYTEGLSKDIEILSILSMLELYTLWQAAYFIFKWLMKITGISAWIINKLKNDTYSYREYALNKVS